MLQRKRRRRKELTQVLEVAFEEMLFFFGTGATGLLAAGKGRQSETGETTSGNERVPLELKEVFACKTRIALQHEIADTVQRGGLERMEK